MKSTLQDPTITVWLVTKANRKGLTLISAIDNLKTRRAPYPKYALGLTLLVFSNFAMGLGCAEVNPQPDFDRAVGGIRDRLGVTNAYEPSIEPLVEQKVRALLADGLTADEAVSVALLNNRSFQSLFQSIGASRADVVQAGLWTNPSLILGTRLIDGGGRPELSLGFAQQLVDLWQIPVRKKIAVAQLEETVRSVLNAAVLIAREARVGCCNYLWRQRLLEIAEDNLALTKRSYKLAQARLNAGETSPLDAGLVQTQVLQAENEALLARRDLDNAELALMLTLGMARWDNQWSLTDAFTVGRGKVADTERLIEIALQDRFDVQIADARVDAAAQEVDLQLLKVLPSLLIGLQAERNEKRDLPERKLLADTARASIAAGQLTAPTIQSRGQRNIARNMIIDAYFGGNIQITLPIWDQNQAQIAKANFTLQRLIKEREHLLDAIVTDIRQAANNARVAVQQVAVFEERVLPQADSNIKIAQTRYENGEESVLILIEAQNASFVQKRQAADVLRNLLVANAELARACGGRFPNAADASPDNHISPTQVNTNAMKACE